MKLFNRKTKTTSQDVQRELIEKQFLVQHLRHTYAFLNPDLSDEQIQTVVNALCEAISTL